MGRDKANDPATDTAYTNLLVAIQTGSQIAFDDLIVAELGLNPNNANDKKLMEELWAAAKGTQSIEAQAAYPGSAGW